MDSLPCRKRSLDPAKLIKALEKALGPISATRIAPWGTRVIVEVEQSRDLLRVARCLESGIEGGRWDWLDHLSAVHQPSGDLVFSAFIESRGLKSLGLVLRWHVHCGGSEERVGATSLREIWSEALRLEYEIAALFGVTFRNEAGAVVETGADFLPKGWVGFPLRKNYLPPMEFLDIAHSRSPGQTSPDEFGVVPEPILDGPGGW